MKKRFFTEEYSRNCWDANAENWACLVQAREDTYREEFNNPAFMRFVGKLEGRKTLDLGCGEGYNTRLFAKNGAKMTGIDISRKMIEIARKEEEKYPLGIRYI